MSPSFLARFLVGGVLVAGTLAGCQSDVEQRVAVASLSSPCRINSDCSELLLCVFELCHEQCESSRDCPRGARCVTTDQGRNVCQLPEEAACSAAHVCPGRQVCGPDGQCRDGCRSDADCVTDQLCSSGTCADTSELTEDGRLPVSTDAPPPFLPCAFDSDCPGALACKAGACRVECVTDTECDSGQRCREDVCTPAPPKPGSCLRNSDCEPGLTCIENSCEVVEAPPPPECDYDSDCDEPGQRCTDGACRCECNDDADCASGYLCEDGCACAPSVVLEGDVSVSNDRELAALGSVVQISGQLMIQINRQGSFHVPRLRKVGSLLVGNPGGGFVFDSLEEVDGPINCYEDCALPVLQRSDDIYLGSSLMADVILPKLKKTGNFNLSNNSRLKKVSLPELEEARELQLIGNSELVELSAPKLQTLTGLVVQSNARLRTLSLPLASPTEKVELRATPLIQSITLPRATSLTAWLSISDCAALRYARFPELRFVEQLQLDRLPNLTEVDLASLQEAPAGAQLLELGTAPGFSLSLPALQTGGPFVVSGGHLTALSAPSLKSLLSLGLSGLPSLQALDLRSLRSIGTLDITSTLLSELFTLIKPPTGVGALDSATNLTFTYNASLPVCAVDALHASLGEGLTGELTQYSNLSCPCNGASCQ